MGNETRTLWHGFSVLVISLIIATLALEWAACQVNDSQLKALMLLIEKKKENQQQLPSYAGFHFLYYSAVQHEGPSRCGFCYLEGK